MQVFLVKRKLEKTNILVGVKGSKQYVDSQFGTTSAGLFDKLDSYALKSDKGTISILGKDTDVAFLWTYKLISHF